ncbi:MAG: translation initiation factor IF-2 associated domain-containing protein, partial [Sulfuritalea sp.]|nr:translation initiation factor IF-2 associated domain-containing protein [Sulfuritalea sp.]
MSVAQFAAELKMPPLALIEQLAKAGVVKQASSDTLTEQDKTRLLEFLRKSHGETAPKAKITLTRKQTTEIKAADATGKSRTIQVEVRKKRTFVKRDTEIPAEAPAAALPVSAVPAAPIIDAEQTALREAEAKRQAELAAVQAAELKEKQEREAKARAEAEARLVQLQAQTEAAAAVAAEKSAAP